MPVEVLFLFFGTLFGLGGIILAGQRMQYRHKERLTDPEQLKHLEETVDDLQTEVRILQDSLAGVDERLEFTERLLSGPPGDTPDSR